MKPRKPLPSTWRCLICHVTGIGGTAGWTAHYTTHHQDQKENHAAHVQRR